MNIRRRMGLAPRAALALGLLGTILTPGSRAQGPQVSVEGAPGIPDGRGKLGPSLGSSGTTGLDATNLAPVGGRAGTTTSRAPRDAFDRSSRPAIEPITASFRPAVLLPAQVPSYGDLDLPDILEDEGPPDGLTLEAAIDRLVRENLSLQALKFEIPMAQADVLTASLRANPIFYADAQLVPFGRYSPARPGGQTQYDVNITYPIDVTGKRKKRTEVSQRAKKVTEAQLQDAVRIQIDNLYTVFVDLDASDETVRFSKAFLVGVERLLTINEELLTKGQVTPDVVDAIRAQLEQARLQIREATAAVTRNARSLGLLLNLSPQEAESIRLRASLRDERPLPTSSDALIQMGLNTRPDLLAYRLAVPRAEADTRLARANRIANPYVLVQPFTLQDNRPFGLKSPISYALGVTTELPLFNRNQGNIARASLNGTQTRIELAQLERQVAYDVDGAVREFNLSLDSALQIEREIIPSSRKVREAARRRYQGGETSAIQFIEAQKDYNDVIKIYRDALVRHRRAMLDLNTAVGTRVMP